MLLHHDVEEEVALALINCNFGVMGARDENGAKRPLYATTLNALKGGRITAIGARTIASACQHLGAGRSSPGAPIDHGVGVILEKVEGAKVTAGAPWIVVYHREASTA